MQAEVHEFDRATTEHREVATRLIPGMLQAPAYAQAVLAKIAAARGLEEDLEPVVKARLARSAYLADRTRVFVFLLCESVLTEPVHGTAVQIEQLTHLQELLAQHPRVRFAILPADTDLPVVVEHEFTLLDDTAVIEGHLGELRVSGAAAAHLHRVADTLWAEALKGAAARALLEQALQRLQSRST